MHLGFKILISRICINILANKSQIELTYKHYVDNKFYSQNKNHAAKIKIIFLQKIV